MSSGSADAAWWRGAFGAAYLAAYAHRDDGAAAHEADFAARVLGVAAPSRILDAGCGAGRHTHALAATGLDVVGLDYSADLLAVAASRAAACPHPPRWIRADVRSMPFRAASFDHAVSFFTSFGYFDDAGDRRHLGELRRVVRPGGRLLLDFLNAPRVVATLVSESRRIEGGVTIHETRALRAGRVEKQAEVVAGAAVVARWSESVRLYERDELEGLLAAAGFGVRDVHGDLSGAAWNPQAPRLVLVAEAV